MPKAMHPARGFSSLARPLAALQRLDQREGVVSAWAPDILAAASWVAGWGLYTRTHAWQPFLATDLFCLRAPVIILTNTCVRACVRRTTALPLMFQGRAFQLRQPAEQLIPGGHGSAAPLITWVRSPLLGSMMTCGRSRARRCSTLCSIITMMPAHGSGNLVTEFTVRACARQSTYKCRRCRQVECWLSMLKTHAVFVMHGRRVHSHRRDIPVRPVLAECMPTKCRAVHERRR
jgi:hypothetical protein